MALTDGGWRAGVRGDPPAGLGRTRSRCRPVAQKKCWRVLCLRCQMKPPRCGHIDRCRITPDRADDGVKTIARKSLFHRPEHLARVFRFNDQDPRRLDTESGQTWTIEKPRLTPGEPVRDPDNRSVTHPLERKGQGKRIDRWGRAMRCQIHRAVHLVERAAIWTTARLKRCIQSRMAEINHRARRAILKRQRLVFNARDLAAKLCKHRLRHGSKPALEK